MNPQEQEKAKLAGVVRRMNALMKDHGVKDEGAAATLALAAGVADLEVDLAQLKNMLQELATITRAIAQKK